VSSPQQIATQARPSSTSEPRTEFLLEMYRQTSGHLNRHVLLVWQSVTLLGGAYVAFAFQDKSVISIHVASSIALLLCGWFCANVYDAYGWFDRNLVIITNLERLFMAAEDEKLVHPFFLKHRPEKDLVQHFKIQLFLGIGVALIVLAVHAWNHVLPNLKNENVGCSFEMALPYVTAVASILYCFWVRYQVMSKAAKLRVKSPGL
jgi:hypothetical protein